MEAVLAVLQAVASVSGLAVTIVIAVLVHRAGRRIARAEYAREVNAAWMAVDSLALSSDEVLTDLDRMMHSDSRLDSLGDRRRRWLSYLVINPLMNAHVGAREGLAVGGREADSTERSLKNLVRDDVFYRVVQEYAYDKAFVALCGRLREEQGLPMSPPEDLLPGMAGGERTVQRGGVDER